MRLTKATYFTKDNHYLSSSKLKDYMNDPYYFYRKHVLHEIEPDKTPSMRIGSAVDSYLTGSRARFKKEYVATERRNLKTPPEGITELTMSEYNTAVAIIGAVSRTTIYKEIKRDYKSQVIFSIKRPIGLFCGLAGIPDWFKVVDNKGIIIDLKTTSNVSRGKFYYQALDMGYYFQQAVYQMLLEEKYPQVSSIKSYILAVSNTGDPYKVALFELDDQAIGLYKTRVTDLIKEISNLKAEDYKPQDLTWNQTIQL
jgi:hypothetical protein